MALRMVCTELRLRFGHSKENSKAVVTTQGVTSPSNEQLKEVFERVEEEYHAIVFLYKSDKQRYGKLIKEMEHDFLQKMDPFPKKVSIMCRVLAGWKNKYVNDEIAFLTTGGSPKKEKRKK